MFELLYTSIAQINSPASEITSILEQSRKNNAKLNVTGMLILADGEFAQLLEGEEKTIKQLYQYILNDPRHTDVNVFYDGPIADRAFYGWSMAFKNIDDDVKNELSLQHNFFHENQSLTNLAKNHPNIGKELFLGLRDSL